MAFVEVTKKDHIAVVTMNRPEALNALNEAGPARTWRPPWTTVEADDEVLCGHPHRRGPCLRRRRRHRRDEGPMTPVQARKVWPSAELGNQVILDAGGHDGEARHRRGQRLRPGRRL